MSLQALEAVHGKPHRKVILGPHALDPASRLVEKDLVLGRGHPARSPAVVIFDGTLGEQLAGKIVSQQPETMAHDLLEALLRNAFDRQRIHGEWLVVRETHVKHWYEQGSQDFEAKLSGRLERQKSREIDCLTTDRSA